MSVAAAIDYLQKALAELKTTAPAPIPVRPGDDVQHAIDAAPAGAVLAFEPGSYRLAAGITISKALTLEPTVDVPPGRRARTFDAVTIVGSGTDPTVTIPAGTVGATLLGLTITHTNADQTLVDDRGTGTRLDRCALLGDPVHGQHRGLAANGQETVVVQCLIDDCFAFGRDAQAIMGWDGTRTLLVTDCYLAGGAETVMFGGADSLSADRIPQHITIEHSTLTKNPAWFAAGAQIKNALEIKCGIDIEVSDCVLEYAGTAAGQGGYLILVTPRNQDGTAPWSCIQDVVLTNLTGRFASGVLNILGTDNEQPSGRTTRVTLQDSTFTDIDPSGLTGGDGRIFLFGDGADQVTIQNVTVTGGHIASRGYFYDAPPTGLVLRAITLPDSDYDWKVDAHGAGIAAVLAYAPGTIIDTVTIRP